MASVFHDSVNMSCLSMRRGTRRAVENARQGIRTWDLFLSKLPKMVCLALIRRPAPMPKEQPLQCLTPLKFILEPKYIILIRKLQKV